MARCRVETSAPTGKAKGFDSREHPLEQSLAEQACQYLPAEREHGEPVNDPGSLPDSCSRLSEEPFINFVRTSAICFFYCSAISAIRSSRGPSLPRHSPRSAVLRSRPTPPSAVTPRLPSCASRCECHSRGLRSPVFNAFLSSRAVPATPEERFGALAEHLPEACCLRPLCRGSASSCTLEATSGFATRYGPCFRNRPLASGRRAGPASAGHLTTSRRGPRYPLAQRFRGVGSFHPTRNAPLSRRTQSRTRAPGPRATNVAVTAQQEWRRASPLPAIDRDRFRACLATCRLPVHFPKARSGPNAAACCHGSPNAPRVGK